MTEKFHPFAKVVFSRNFANAKFSKNITLTKISEFTVPSLFHVTFKHLYLILQLKIIRKHILMPLYFSNSIIIGKIPFLKNLCFI